VLLDVKMPNVHWELDTKANTYATNQIISAKINAKLRKNVMVYAPKCLGTL
jgi:hypothetical protein